MWQPKPVSKCCCCFELRLGVLIYSALMIVWGFIQFVIAAAALSYVHSQGHKNAPSISSVPINGPEAYLVIALLSNLYSIAVGAVGIACTSSVDRIRSYNRKTLALTIHFFRMKIFDFIIQEVMDVVATAYSSNVRHTLEQQGRSVRGSDGAFHFGQAINFLVEFFVHAYLVYCVYSYKRKLLDQSRGIFEGDPILDSQKQEIGMTYTTPPGVNVTMTSTPIDGGYGQPAYGTTNAPKVNGNGFGTFNNPAFASGAGFGAPMPANGFGAPPPAFVPPPPSSFGGPTAPARDSMGHDDNPFADGVPPPSYQGRQQ